MKTLTLKQVLSREDIKQGLLSNLFTSSDEVESAVSLVLASDKNNSMSVKTERAGEPVDFENTLHIDNDKKVYLLESRVFFVKNGQLLNAYLEILDENGEIVQDKIDDVWSYADWEVVK